MVRLHLLACMADKASKHGSVAQLGARASFKRGVAGSSPVATISTAKARRKRAERFLWNSRGVESCHRQIAREDKGSVANLSNWRKRVRVPSRAPEQFDIRPPLASFSNRDVRVATKEKSYAMAWCIDSARTAHWTASRRQILWKYAENAEQPATIGPGRLLSFQGNGQCASSPGEASRH
jgi:hypothetical protein